MNRHTDSTLRLLLASAASAFAFACSETDKIIDPAPQPDPRPGQTSFVSADGRAGQESGAAPTLAGDDKQRDAEGGSSRTVEEGDIYRVGGDEGVIYNLNNYRGLQVIEVSDAANPRVVGTLRISGSPVEMYVVGTRAYLLLNNWYGYYGGREDILPTAYQGGVVLAADVSDPRAPREIGRAEIPGYIRTSRLTRSDAGDALYVAANDGEKTYVKSLRIDAGGGLVAASEIDLGGYVRDIQATTERLLVARQTWTGTGSTNEVSIIDISNPNGTMIEGASIATEGVVASKYNMGVVGDIVRVVSGSDWGSRGWTNHLETFDASDIQAPTRVDHETFGDGEQLFATLFVDDKAFCVTYLRRDPFHTFRIDAAGDITPVSEFIVSGWNDFFRPVLGNRRLIGIGRNDEAGNHIAVSLYEIEDLSNPKPLLDRKEIQLEWAWSDAQWDDKAFSVLESATHAVAEDGTVETGLILLPFSGWDGNTNEGISAVQIFTFSDRTLTKRGVMNQGTQVRRSFVVDAQDSTTGNLSDVELSLFDTSSPDSPVELGRVELAPDYSDILFFGSHGVRRHSTSYWYGWWRNPSEADVEDTLEIIDLAVDPDAAPALATIAIPAGSRIFQMGDRLAVVTNVWEQPAEGEKAEPTLRTTIANWDLAIPEHPVILGTLITTELPYGDGFWGGYYGPYARGGAEPVDAGRFADDCLGCGGYYWGGNGGVYVAGDALVFAKANYEQELVGVATYRSIWAGDDGSYRKCYDSSTGSPQACSYFTGGRSCRSLVRVDGTVEPEVCTGAFYRCAMDTTGASTCSEVAESEVSTQQNTYSYEEYRGWQHYDFHVVDSSDPAYPRIGAVVSMQRDEETVGVLARGDALFVSFKKPVAVENDPRGFVQYFFRRIDLSNAASPHLSGAVNVPGELIEVDGATLVTRDLLWGDNIVETSIDKLTLLGGLARLDAVRRFEDRVVDNTMLDGHGHVLVSHSQAWNYGVTVPATADAGGATKSGGGRAGLTAAQASDDQRAKLEILDLAAADFASLSSLPIDTWASLSGAIAGRALFTVPGGILVVNLDDARAPYAQAYFPLIGWGSSPKVHERGIYIAANRFGLYRMSADTFNLLSN